MPSLASRIVCVSQSVPYPFRSPPPPPLPHPDSRLPFWKSMQQQTAHKSTTRTPHAQPYDARCKMKFLFLPSLFPSVRPL